MARGQIRGQTSETRGQSIAQSGKKRTEQANNKSIEFIHTSGKTLPECLQAGATAWPDTAAARCLLTDTPWHKCAGVLPSSRRLAICPCGTNSRGPLSRSVSRGKPVCFRVPHGTASNGRKSFFKNI